MADDYAAATSKSTYMVEDSNRIHRLWSKDKLLHDLAACGMIEFFEGWATDPTTLSGYSSSKVWLRTETGVTDSAATIRVWDGSGSTSLLASWPVMTFSTYKLLINSFPVVGPGSATDNAIARFDGTGGRTIQNSTVTVSDTGLITDDVSLTQIDGASWGQAVGLRLGTNATAAGSGSAGSANQAGINVQLNIPSATSSAAAYEKAGILVIAQTSDPSALPIYRDCVGIDMRGYIAAGNTGGRAWGGYSEGRVIATGDGLCYGHEFYIINNGTNQSTVNTVTSKYGVHVVSGGTQPSTAGIKLTADDSANRFHNGIYIDQSAIVVGGYAFRLDSLFQVDREGRVGIKAAVNTSYAAYIGGNTRINADFPTFSITGTNAGTLQFYKSDNGTNVKTFEIQIGASATTFRNMNDAYSLAANWLTVTHGSGTHVPALINFEQTTPVKITGELRVAGDTSGAASTTTFTGTSDVTANSSGTGTIKFKGATSRDSSGFIKIYVGTTAYYVPIFSAITG